MEQTFALLSFRMLSNGTHSSRIVLFTENFHCARKFSKFSHVFPRKITVGLRFSVIERLFPSPLVDFQPIFVSRPRRLKGTGGSGEENGLPPEFIVPGKKLLPFLPLSGRSFGTVGSSTTCGPSLIYPKCPARGVALGAPRTLLRTQSSLVAKARSNLQLDGPSPRWRTRLQLNKGIAPSCDWKLKIGLVALLSSRDFAFVDESYVSIKNLSFFQTK